MLLVTKMTPLSFSNGHIFEIICSEDAEKAKQSEEAAERLAEEVCLVEMTSSLLTIPTSVSQRRRLADERKRIAEEVRKRIRIVFSLS